MSQHRDKDEVAKEAAMKSRQPSEAVAPTPTRIAMGAARAAPAVSSEMCAAESSAGDESEGCECDLRRGVRQMCGLTASQGPHGCREREQERPPACESSEDGKRCWSLGGRTVRPPGVVLEHCERCLRRHPLFTAAYE